MKKLFLLLFLAAFTKANCQEINFINDDWTKAVALSKEQHKPIFVDYYTDWCVWCKEMDKTTYKDKGVADYVNSNFISVKMNAEKDYGINLAMKYSLKAFPTFGYIDESGRLASTSVGYLPTDEFLKTMKEKVEIIKKGEYVKGVSNVIDLPFPDFYKAAYGANGKRKMADPQTVADYLHKQTDLLSEVSFDIITTFKTDSNIDKYFMANLQKYQDLYGKDVVEDKISKIINTRFKVAVEKKDTVMLADVMALNDKYFPEHKVEARHARQKEYYLKTGNWKKYCNMMDEDIATNFVGGNGINTDSWYIFENADDKYPIEKAIGWMSKVIVATPNYAFMDTYASLLYKDGKYNEAEEYANKAIETGKSSKEDTSPTEKLLEKIKGAKASK